MFSSPVSTRTELVLNRSVVSVRKRSSHIYTHTHTHTNTHKHTHTHACITHPSFLPLPFLSSSYPSSSHRSSTFYRSRSKSSNLVVPPSPPSFSLSPPPPQLFVVARVCVCVCVCRRTLKKKGTSTPSLPPSASVSVENSESCPSLPVHVSPDDPSRISIVDVHVSFQPQVDPTSLRGHAASDQTV